MDYVLFMLLVIGIMILVIVDEITNGKVGYIVEKFSDFLYKTTERLGFK